MQCRRKKLVLTLTHKYHLLLPSSFLSLIASSTHFIPQIASICQNVVLF